MPLDLRRSILAEIYGACNRLGQGPVVAFIKVLGVASGYAKDCDDEQLIRVLCWCLREMNKVVPTLKQRERGVS